MVDLIARTSSDSELDTHRLNSVLDSITSELTIPFLERRARSKSHKKNALEELNFVIQELTGRERELQAAVGIAKMLIDKNNALTSKLKSVRTKKHYYKESVRELKNDNQALKNEIIAADEKYQQVNTTLIKAEEQQLVIIAEHQRLLRENSLKQESNEVGTIGINEVEVNELIGRHKEQYDYLMRNKTELEKKIAGLEEIKEKGEQELSKVKENADRFERELLKSKKKCKELEDLLSEAENSTGKLENKYNQLTLDYNRVKIKAEKLTEDIQVIEKAKVSEPKRKKHARHVSLMSELEEINMDISEPSNSTAFTLCSPVHSRLNITKPALVASVIGRKPRELNRRKDPLEEYFTLITQAIKLNSPYMDAICLIPPNELYEKAIKEDIPFHRWYIWVESQLTAAYIQLVYKINSKSKSIF